MTVDAVHVIFETVHGSRAYGLDTPESDLDLKGVLVGPPAWYFGFREAPEQQELGPDHVRYELRKFFRLAASANPTLLELLFTDPADHRIVTPAGERLLAARERFLSRRVKDSFAGYAMSQLARIQTHRRWLLHPPAHEPTRGEFGLPERTVIPKDQLGAAEALLADGRASEADLSPNFLAILDRERRYRSARKEWEHYQSWLRTRNPRRAALEAQHGYDTKHAMHLVRLLRMGREILSLGTVQVRRPDADDLRGVRAGAWTYDALMANAEALAADVRAAARTSPLPEAPDDAALDALCVELVQSALAQDPR